MAIWRGLILGAMVVVLGCKGDEAAPSAKKNPPVEQVDAAAVAPMPTLTVLPCRG